tara:strand:- start:185 stop:1120 length:936 start_codon:yes stop_codon:yes gene_type:complete
MKRVRRKHRLATFTYLGGSDSNEGEYSQRDTILIQLNPESLCFDAKVTCFVKANGEEQTYKVATVSTEREKQIPHRDLHAFNVSWTEQGFTILTSNIARAAKTINGAKSFTPARVVENGIRRCTQPFAEALKNAQNKSHKLQRETFESMSTTDKDEALLEYCLSIMQNRPVRADVAHQLTDRVRAYLDRKEELGASSSICAGLQPLGLYRVEGNDRVYYHRPTFGDDQREAIPYTNINDLPEEVLSKLATMQAAGEQSMDDVGWSGCKVLDGVGALVPDISNRTHFLEAAQCVYVSPKTMTEVACLANRPY